MAKRKITVPAGYRLRPSGLFGPVDHALTPVTPSHKDPTAPESIAQLARAEAKRARRAERNIREARHVRLGRVGAKVSEGMERISAKVGEITESFKKLGTGAEATAEIVKVSSRRLRKTAAVKYEVEPQEEVPAKPIVRRRITKPVE